MGVQIPPIRNHNKTRLATKRHVPSCPSIMLLTSVIQSSISQETNVTGNVRY